MWLYAKGHGRDAFFAQRRRPTCAHNLLSTFLLSNQLVEVSSLHQRRPVAVVCNNIIYTNTIENVSRATGNNRFISRLVALSYSRSVTLGAT